MIYNNIVMDCFLETRQVGVLDISAPLTVYLSAQQESQQLIIIHLYLQCDDQGLINKANFKAMGSPFVIAGLEWLCRETQGKSIYEIDKLNYKILIEKLAIPQSQYFVALPIETIYNDVLALMKMKFEDYQL